MLICHDGILAAGLLITIMDDEYPHGNLISLPNRVAIRNKERQRISEDRSYPLHPPPG